MAEYSNRDWENEVIDRLARIETEQKQIRTEISDFKALETRIATLEAESNKRKGISLCISAIVGFLGVFVGGIVSFLLWRYG